MDNNAAAHRDIEADGFAFADQYQPSRLGVESAWYGHLPFAYWLVASTAPRLVVELGTHAGVSYSAFCDAVIARGLETRCFAIDTWEGDDQAGHYGSDVYTTLRAFHDSRYKSFSTLLRQRFDDALPQFPDAAIDLLHIDGFHSYEAARHDFDAWRPKLSDRAVVLFHDTNVRLPGFGVWKLWEELARDHPGFAFWHSHGLGVLAVGQAAPAPVRALCEQGAEGLATVRARFSALGARWEAESKLHRLEHNVGILQRDFDKLLSDLQWSETRARDRYAHEVATQRNRFHEATKRLAELRKLFEERDRAFSALQQVHHALYLAHQQCPPMAERLRELEQHYAELTQQHTELRHHHHQVVNSSLWRAAQPLRRLGAAVPPSMHGPLRRLATSTLRGLRRGLPPAPPAIAPAPPAFTAIPAPPSAPVAESRTMPDTARDFPPPGFIPADPRLVVYVSGEPATPGHLYRVARPAAALKQGGIRSWIMTVPEAAARHDVLREAHLTVIWRAAWSPEVEGIVNAAHDNGGQVLFDIDDLMFDPMLARTEIIDAIRSLRLTESGVADFYQRIGRTMHAADAFCCTTNELAYQMRRFQKTTFVLRNGFDEETHARARLALRGRRLSDSKAGESDALIRLGYAGGTRTHQRDFKQAAAAIARVLKARPEARLVLFEHEKGAMPLLDLEEFPELEACSAQIEWRDMVPLSDLPDEMARFDINLAPLETGNLFCEAKSELKYFEAALVEVPTVASPTGPLRRAIRDGETGFLAATEEDWYRHLLALVDDPALRARIGKSAYHDVLIPFGPEWRRDDVIAILDQMDGGVRGAKAFAARLQATARPRPLPPTVMPRASEMEVLFQGDTRIPAEVTVIIPLYNYAHFVTEALDSVLAQTEPNLDLVIVDDGSTDNSAAVALHWVAANQLRFNRALVLRNKVNAGLPATRNRAFDAAETPYVLPLDADNRLRPACVSKCLAALRDTAAGYAYPIIQRFGARDDTVGHEPYRPMRFAGGNYIDAMALIAKSTWVMAGGYAEDFRSGYEDYEFWCRCAEHGVFGIRVPEVLADYRAHDSSMLRRQTDAAIATAGLIETLERRHPWMNVPKPE